MEDFEGVGFRGVFEYLAVFDVVDPAGDFEGAGFEGLADHRIGAEVLELVNDVPLGDGGELIFFGQFHRHDMAAGVFAVGEPAGYSGQVLGFVGAPDGFHGAAVGVAADDDVRNLEDFEGVFKARGFAGVFTVKGRHEVAGVTVDEEFTGGGVSDEGRVDAGVGAGDEERGGRLALGETLEKGFVLGEDVALKCNYTFADGLHRISE